MSEIKTARPNELDDQMLHAMHDLARAACEHTFLDGLDVDAYVGEFDRFAKSHLDPMEEVRNPVGRRNANQEYHHQRYAFVYQAGKLVAWGAGVRNVSGGGDPEGPHNESLHARTIRFGKRLSIVSPPQATSVLGGRLRNRNYYQLIEEYVEPSLQSNGHGEEIAEELTRFPHAFPLQPLVTYYYPGIYRPGIPLLRNKFERVGMEVIDDRYMDITGLGNVQRLTMKAPTVYGARQLLLQQMKGSK